MSLHWMVEQQLQYVNHFHWESRITLVKKKKKSQHKIFMLGKKMLYPSLGLGAIASFQGRFLSVLTYQIFLKFTIKFEIAFSRQAKNAAESKPSISLPFTESLVRSQPWTAHWGRYKRSRQNLCLCLAYHLVEDTILNY